MSDAHLGKLVHESWLWLSQKVEDSTLIESWETAADAGKGFFDAVPWYGKILTAPLLIVAVPTVTAVIYVDSKTNKGNYLEQQERQWSKTFKDLYK